MHATKPVPQSESLPPRCSVVVCTRNRADSLDRCLAALARQTYRWIDVLVVDNAPSDDCALSITRRWGARYLVEPIPGLSGARNTGARACAGEVVAFTDDDAVPEPGWLAELAARFSDPGVGVATGRTLPLVAGAGAAVAPEHATDLGPAPIRLDRSHPLWFEMASFGGIGNGNNMAFRRCLFEGPWTGFDERLGRGAPLSSCEEHRAFAQLIEMGHAILYVPEAVVRHPVPETPGARRRHYLSSRKDLAGYAAFLFLATPHKRRVAKYVVEAAFGRKREWRFRTGTVPPGLVPRWRVLMAPMTGLWRCVRSLLRGSGRPSSVHAPAPGRNPEAEGFPNRQAAG